MDFDLDRLENEAKDAENKKAIFGAIGAVAKGFDNIPSSHSLLYGKGQGGGNTAEIFDNLQKQVGDPWEKQKKTYEAFKAAKEGEALKTASDPNSTRAKALKLMISKKNGISPADLEQMTEKDLISLYGDQGKLAEIQAQSQMNFQNDMAKQRSQQNFQASENEKNRLSEMEKERAKQIVEAGKKTDPRNLSGTDKARYDNALMVLKAIDQMGTALDNGDNTYKMIGDNKYTEAERKAAEAYGRMQSGGAINKEEEERFLAMLPRATDKKEMQRHKLISQRDEMISRLRTLGFTPEQAGYVPTEFQYGMSPEQIQEIETKTASKPNMSDEQIKAYENQAKLELIRRANQKKTSTAGM